MKEFERLTERDKFGNADIIGVDTDSLIGNLTVEQGVKTSEALNRLADFEDKIENGLLTELPCKEGTTVYYIDKECYNCPSSWADLSGVYCDDDGECDDLMICGEECKKHFRIGKCGFRASLRNRVYGTDYYTGKGAVDNYRDTFFLTKAEAEEKLKEILEK